ncbi:hypothetical protein QCA50_001190 [Cerrena zonata]
MNKPAGFQLSSELYFPKLASPKTYIYAPPKPRLYLKGEHQQTLDLLKDILYQWLDIPSNDKKAEYRCMIVNYLIYALG